MGAKTVQRSLYWHTPSTEMNFFKQVHLKKPFTYDIHIGLFISWEFVLNSDHHVYFTQRYANVQVDHTM